MDTPELNHFELRCTIELAKKKYKEVNDIMIN